jgi:hypothetical protein
MRGYLARRASLYTKKIDINAPKIMRHMTVGELQGKISPPKSRPRSNINTKPMMVILPNQSIAWRPSFHFVLGLCTLKKTSSSANVVPDIGRLTRRQFVLAEFRAGD